MEYQPPEQCSLCLDMTPSDKLFTGQDSLMPMLHPRNAI